MLLKFNLKLLFVLILAVGIPLLVIVAQKQQEIRQRAQEVPSTSYNAVVLELSPLSITKTQGDTFNTDIIINSGNLNIIGADVTLNFDKNVLEIVEAPQNSSSAFNDILVSKGDNENGILHFAGINNISPIPSGTVKIASFTFKAKTAGTSSLTFSNVQITAYGHEEAIEYSGRSSSYIVELPTPTPTPTPSIAPSCELLKQKIQAAFWSTCSDNNYDAIADVNKDKFVNGIDTSFLIGHANGLRDETACQKFLNDQNNPCITPSPTSGGKVCAQIITPARNLQTGECIEFGTPCDIPQGWTIVDNCEIPSKSVPTSMPQAPSPIRSTGDANLDGSADIIDYNIWRNEFLALIQTIQSDFNNDKKIDLLDFANWRNAFIPQ